jgi:hypothetical protein
MAGKFTFESNTTSRCRWCGGRIPDSASLRGFCGRACVEIASWVGWDVSTQKSSNV